MAKLRFKGVTSIGSNLKTAAASFVKVIAGQNRQLIVASNGDVHAVNKMSQVRFWDPTKGVAHARVLEKELNLTLASDGTSGEGVRAFTVACSGCKEVIVAESKLKHCILCASDIDDSEYEEVELDLPSNEELDALEDSDEDEDLEADEDSDGDDLEDGSFDTLDEGDYLEEDEDEDDETNIDLDDETNIDLDDEGDDLEEDELLEDQDEEEEAIDDEELIGDDFEDEDEDIEIEDEPEEGDDFEDDEDIEIGEDEGDDFEGEEEDFEDADLGDSMDEMDEDEDLEFEDEGEEGDSLEDDEDAEMDEDESGDDFEGEEEGDLEGEEDNADGDFYIDDEGSVNIDLVDGAELEDTDETDVEYSSAMSGNKRWIASVNGMPVAIATQATAGSNKEIFHTEKFGKVAKTVIASSGIVGLKSIGFVPIVVAAPVRGLIQASVDAEIAKSEGAVQKKLQAMASDFQVSMGMAAAGINRGFFGDVVNPLKVRMWEELSSLGIPSPHRVIDRVFKETAEDFSRVLIEKASELQAKPAAIRAELSKAIIGSNYLAVAEDEEECDEDVEDCSELGDEMADRIEAGSMPFANRTVTEATSVVGPADSFKNNLDSVFKTL